jgi:hypothetical protein
MDKNSACSGILNASHCCLPGQECSGPWSNVIGVCQDKKSSASGMLIATELATKRNPLCTADDKIRCWNAEDIPT